MTSGTHVEDKHPTLLYALGAVGIAIFLIALGIYAWCFGDRPISDDPAHWGQLGDYLAGTVGPLIAFLALIGLLWTIRINERELRYTRRELEHSREALEQNNAISTIRAKREQLEAQKADIYRIVIPITKDIEAALGEPISVPSSIAMSDGSTVRFSGQGHQLRDLFFHDSFRAHRHHIAKNNETALRKLTGLLATLERYLRAYERLADDDFFAGYYKSNYRDFVTLLNERGMLPIERRQDILDYYHSGVDVLSAAESSITQPTSTSGSASIKFRIGGTLTDGSEAAMQDYELELIEAEPGTGRELPHVFVHTYPKPTDQSVRLANVTWAYSSAPPGGVPQSSEALQARPMSHDDAMRWAITVAQNYGFPRVYWQRDEPAERN